MKKNECQMCQQQKPAGEHSALNAELIGFFVCEDCVHSAKSYHERHPLLRSVMRNKMFKVWSGMVFGHPPSASTLIVVERPNGFKVDHEQVLVHNNRDGKLYEVPVDFLLSECIFAEAIGWLMTELDMHCDDFKVEGKEGTYYLTLGDLHMSCGDLEQLLSFALLSVYSRYS